MTAPSTNSERQATLDRLAAAGNDLPRLTPPDHAYQRTSCAGGLIQTAGQTPKVAGTLMVTGICGTDVDIDAARQATELCAVNALAALDDAVSLDRIGHLFQLIVYVASAPGFDQQAHLADAASTLLNNVFGERGHHTRTAIGVACLPGGAPVEVELSAWCPDGDAR
jgi:enamine deaminase RidA (YjgF/YER057c/UK114 family)